MFEGDILLTQRQKALIRATDYASKHSVHERAVVIGAAMKWPNAQVPYELHSSLRKGLQFPICYVSISYGKNVLQVLLRGTA